MRGTTAFFLAGLFLAAGASGASARDTILSFDGMATVAHPFLAGDNNPVGGLNGGGRPWVVDDASGRLDSDGTLRVRVTGLIIPASEGPQFGINPVPFFRAAVSCNLGRAGFDVVLTDNGAEVMIGDPRNGDARIEAKLDLPSPCLAPIVFVTSNTGAWFAVTGNSSAPDPEMAQSGGAGHR
jgi:hypothetical protein